MIKKTAPFLVLLLTVACASAPMTSSSNTSFGASTAPDYILLSQPNQIRTWDYSKTPYGFHVRGTLTNKGFVPSGQIEGRGKLCADGQDWLSLSDLSVHKAGEGSPSGSYILGCATASGFQPASRSVVTQ